MQNHASQLRAKGFEVLALGVGAPLTEEELTEWKAIDAKNLPATIQQFSFSNDLYSQVLDWKPDIIHQHGVWKYPSIVAGRIQKNTKARKVISPHGMLEAWALRNGSLKKKLASIGFEKRNLDDADCIHCFQNEVKSLRAFGVSSEVAVIPNGVHLPPIEKVAHREVLPDSNNRKTMLFLGRIHAKKGISETLRGWSEFKKLSPEEASRWRLVFVGWGEESAQQKLEREIVELSLQRDVSFFGPMFGQQKEAALQSADAFILASHSEGFPMAVLEALASRIPAFITRECNIPELFHSQAAIRIDHDPKNIARTLVTYLGSSEADRIAMNGRAFVEGNYTWEIVGDRLAELYSWLLTGSARPNFVFRAE